MKCWASSARLPKESRANATVLQGVRIHLPLKLQQENTGWTEGAVMNSGKILAIFVVLLSGTAALASITGTISAIVTDPGGAVVAGASVKATNIQTGVKQTIRTDTKGFYSFPALPIGTYTISVQRGGFKDFQQTNIVIDANSAVRADAKLQVGAVQQQVTVSSTAVQVETTNTQMGEVIT